MVVAGERHSTGGQRKPECALSSFKKFLVDKLSIKCLCKLLSKQISCQFYGVLKPRTRKSVLGRVSDTVATLQCISFAFHHMGLQCPGECASRASLSISTGTEGGTDGCHGVAITAHL